MYRTVFVPSEFVTRCYGKSCIFPIVPQSPVFVGGCNGVPCELIPLGDQKRPALPPCYTPPPQTPRCQNNHPKYISKGYICCPECGTKFESRKSLYSSPGSNTICPGPYLESKFPYIAEEVNKRLGSGDTIKVGDIVVFKGGKVYISSDAQTTNVIKPSSMCKVTKIYNGLHPYHCVSQDGKGVYGWVDAERRDA